VSAKPIFADAAALRAQNEHLRLRLQEAEETLQAIRRGDVDALVMDNEIYTLESATDASNRLRKDVLAQMDDAVLAFDLDDRIIFMNAAAERQYGIAAPAFLGRPKASLYRDEVLDPEDAGHHAPAPASQSQAARSFSTHHCLDGVSIQVETTLSPLRDGSGELIGSLAVIRDVSERIRAERTIRAAAEELARRERQFATLVENAPDVFARMDRGLRHLYVSPVIETYNGLAPSAHIGKTNAELGMPGALCAQWDAAMRRVFATGQPGHIKFAFQTPSGSTRIFESRLIPEFAGDGSVESVLSIASDITERETADQALRRNQAQLKFILDSAQIGEWELDLGSEAIKSSHRHASCFGYAQVPQAWTLATMLDHLHPEDRSAVEGAFERSRRFGEDLHFESRVVWPDHGVHWIEAHGSFYGADGAARLVGIVSDVTARKLAEESLRNTDRRKDEFLATLAHELRNPLAPISNALQIMRLTHEPAAVENARGIIERQLGQLVHLVDDLLDVNRISQGKVELRKVDVDVADVVRGAVETSRPLIDSGRHTLTLQLPPPQSAIVNADPTRLGQVVANLLNNAAKYTPEGGHIEVCTRCEGDEVVITVTDDGVGLPPQMLPRVFDMFTQADHTLSRSQGGLGIGLTLVKRLAEMHGGKVLAESEGPGRGCTFTVRIPLVRGRSGAATVEAEVRSPQGQRRRILVVDDNRDIAASTAELLSMLGHEAVIAHDGDEAIALVATEKPSIVLLDIGLPKRSGHEVARWIRKQPGGADVLLIALSGWGQKDDVRKSREAGFDMHLVKPVELDTLIDIISRRP
jgi:PAS domain S-box-containing protein